LLDLRAHVRAAFLISIDVLAGSERKPSGKPA
jgi:hypothetical protein